MRFTNVKVYSNDVEAAEFSLLPNDSNSKYQIKSVVGLDADDIVSRFYGFGAVTKPKYYDLRLKSREIVLRIVLNPRYVLDETPSDIRDDLYRAIASSRTGQIELHLLYGASIVATISGFISKFEAALFSKSPEVQITIRCDDPLFRGVAPIIFEASDLNTGTPISVPDSLSTAPHGFEMELTVTDAFTNFVMREEGSTEWVFEIIPGLINGNTGFMTGDVLYFSSGFSTKSLYIVRSSVTYHLLDKVTTTSVWPILFPGDNQFHLDNTDKFTWESISYYPVYWGV